MKRFCYRLVVLLPALLMLGCQPATEPSDVDRPTDQTDAQPADTEPADTEPADTEPADTEPADTEPADTEPGEKSPESDNGAGGEASTELEAGSENLEQATRQARKALRSFGDFTMEQKDQFVADVRDELKELNSSIDKLEQQGSDLAGEARQQWEQRMEDLKQKREAVREKLPEIEQAGDDAWKELRDGVSGAWSELKEAYQSIRDGSQS